VRLRASVRIGRAFGQLQMMGIDHSKPVRMAPHSL
jgi:hypothetical protein